MFMCCAVGKGTQRDSLDLEWLTAGGQQIVLSELAIALSSLSCDMRISMQLNTKNNKFFAFLASLPSKYVVFAKLKLRFMWVCSQIFFNLLKSILISIV